MADSFFFYDLETSGINPRSARIMQFAGQRTDLELQPIGEPTNVLIKLTPDVLPEPEAVLINRVTPQQTIAEGLTEAEFLVLFHETILQPDTIFVGYNSIRFDDEFMRFLLYRNFYDAYEWQWANGCSRWDMLDVVRMTRALRPDGISWPFAANGKPSNRLEFLTKVNKLDHSNAHDALSDVGATIAVARLIRSKQPELFEYTLSMRAKQKVTELVRSDAPFIYTSGHYPSDILHTSAVTLLAEHPQVGGALVYDLRHDPRPFLKMDVDQLEAAWQFSKDPNTVRLPVKTLKYNRCPVIAPIGVIKDEVTQQRLSLSLTDISRNLALLRPHTQAFAKKLFEVIARLDATQAKTQASLIDNQLTVDSRLYENFISKADKQVMQRLRAAQPEALADFAQRFQDERLVSLLPLYKARNFPAVLDDSERAEWESFCKHQLYDGGSKSRLGRYFARLQELAAGNVTAEQAYILEELQLYGQSLMPVDVIET